MADILPARTILTGQVSTKLWADPTNEAKVLERGQQTSCEPSQARSATIVHNVLPPLYSPTIPLGWGSMDGYWVVRPNPKPPADLH